MNQTTNYQLNQWDPDDKVLRTDFNADNAKIDAALAALAARAGALETEMTGKGNCQMYYGTYTGTGSGPTKLIFPGKPLFVLITSAVERVSITMVRGNTTVFSYDGTYASDVNLVWGENSVTITQPDGYASYQCNIKGQAYPVIALMEMDG